MRHLDVLLARPMKTLGLLLPMLSPIVDISPLQHLSQQPPDLLDGQLLAADVLLLILLVLRGLHRDVGELGWETGCEVSSQDRAE